MDMRPVDITGYGFSILQIETMARCNMGCDFCAYPLRKDKASILPEESVLNVLDSISAASGLEHVCLSQFNEPLLDERIYSFIKKARARKLPVMIVTNGLAFDSKETIDRLIDAGPEYIKVSVQVLNPGLFMRARKSGRDFQKYKEGIFNFLAAAQTGSSGITVDVACNFLRGAKRLKRALGLEYGDPSVYDTVKDLEPDIRSFLKELQDRLPSYRHDDARIGSFLKEAGLNYVTEPGLKISENISLKIKPFIYGRRLTEFFPVKRAKPCASSILGVLASGFVVPCCMAYDDMLFLGNVREEPLAVILEKSRSLLANIRSGGSNLPSACRNCLGAPTRRGVLLKKLRYAFLGR